MKFLEQLKNRFSIMSELITFFWKRCLWWMIPMVVVLQAFGLLIILPKAAPWRRSCTRWFEFAAKR